MKLAIFTRFTVTILKVAVQPDKWRLGCVETKSQLDGWSESISALQESFLSYSPDESSHLRSSLFSNWLADEDAGCQRKIDIRVDEREREREIECLGCGRVTNTHNGGAIRRRRNTGLHYEDYEYCLNKVATVLEWYINKLGITPKN